MEKQNQIEQVLAAAQEQEDRIMDEKIEKLTPIFTSILLNPPLDSPHPIEEININKIFKVNDGTGEFLDLQLFTTLKMNDYEKEVVREDVRERLKDFNYHYIAVDVMCDEEMENESLLIVQ